MRKQSLIGMLALMLCLSSAATAEGYTAGAYTAAAQGFGGEVSVTVTVDEEKIVNVTAVGEQETAGIGSRAVEMLPQAMVAANSADVDGVAGATISSTAIKAAAASALAQAAGKGTEMTLTDGVYTATGRGFNLTVPVNVTVTVEGGKIASVVIGENGETNGMPAAVEAAMIPNIVAYQTLDVDAATGATATSGAVKEAVLDCLMQAGADAASAYAGKVPVSDAVEEYTADVVVVGMGGAGTAAALAAAEQGASVFAIDKAAKWAGTSAITSGPSGVNVPSQVAAEIPEWTDAWTKEKRTKAAGENLVDADALFADWEAYTTIDGVQEARIDIVRKVVDSYGPTLDWLTEQGFAFDNAKGFVGGKWAIFCSYTGNKALTESYFAAAYDKFTQMGGRYLLSTAGEELIFEDGKVAGVKAKKADGTTVLLHADKVILATGGFGGNDDMMQEYLGESWKLYGMAQNTGAGIQMALSAGAATRQIDMFPMSHFVAPAMITTAFDAANNDIPYGMVATAEAMAVDKHGSRMLNESAIAMNAYQYGARYYTVYAAEQIDVLRTQGFAKAASGRYLSQGGVAENTPLTEIDKVIDKGVEMGFIYKAATLDELAAQTGMDADALEQSVAGYKAEGDAMGKDAALFERLGEINPESSYYVAVTGAPYIYATCAGVDVNSDMQVLDNAGQPIDGLYATGLDSMGVLFTNDKGYANYGGIAQGYAFVSGQIAGENAAAK